MDIENIKEKFYNGDYNYDIKIPRIVSQTHIFDENLSVKRNREMVVEHNEKVRQMYIDCHHERAKRIQQLRQDVRDYIIECYHFTLDQATTIEDFAFAEDDFSTYFDYVDDLATMAESFYTKTNLFKIFEISFNDGEFHNGELPRTYYIAKNIEDVKANSKSYKYFSELKGDVQIIDIANTSKWPSHCFENFKDFTINIVPKN